MFSEEMKVRDLVTRTTQVLRRASAGPDDIGSRYSRLLELLWQQKSMPATSPAGTHQGSELLMPNDSSALSHHTSDPHVHFSPANDFSWLDLEAVGDYVSGDQMSGTNTLALDTFQNPDLFIPGQDRSQTWQVPTWSGDMSSNLLF